jgi:hypothetical protein
MQPSKGLHNQVVKIVVPYTTHVCYNILLFCGLYVVYSLIQSVQSQDAFSFPSYRETNILVLHTCMPNDNFFKNQQHPEVFKKIPRSLGYYDVRI